MPYSRVFIKRIEQKRDIYFSAALWGIKIIQIFVIKQGHIVGLTRNKMKISADSLLVPQCRAKVSSTQQGLMRNKKKEQETGGFWSQSALLLLTDLSVKQIGVEEG